MKNNNNNYMIDIMIDHLYYEYVSNDCFTILYSVAVVVAAAAADVCSVVATRSMTMMVGLLIERGDS